LAAIVAGKRLNCNLGFDVDQLIAPGVMCNSLTFLFIFASKTHGIVTHLSRYPMNSLDCSTDSSINVKNSSNYVSDSPIHGAEVSELIPDSLVSVTDSPLYVLPAEEYMPDSRKSVPGTDEFVT